MRNECKKSSSGFFLLPYKQNFLLPFICSFLPISDFSWCHMKAPLFVSLSFKCFIHVNTSILSFKFLGQKCILWCMVAPTHKTVPTKTWTFGQSVSQHLSCLFSTLKIYMNVIYHIKSSFIFDIFIQQTYIKNMSEFIKKEKNITVGKYSRYIRWYNKATTVTIICQTLCLALYMRCLI